MCWQRNVGLKWTDSGVPCGWKLCNLPEFAQIEMGQSPPSGTYNHDGQGIPFFQGKAEFGRVFPRVDKYCSAPRKIAKAGSTLLSIRAPVGPTNLAKSDYCIGRGLAAICPLGGISSRFILYLFRSIESTISDKGTGSTFKAVNKTFLEELEFALPPLKEQRRIVARIEELFSELDKGVESLKKARTQLKKYRQAVLKQAFEGKLTAKWREENRHKLEQPEHLRARIEQERVARYEQRLQQWKTAIRKWEADGKSDRKPRRPRKPKELLLSPAEVETLPPLPSGWTYLRLGLAIDEPKYGSSKKCDYDYKGTGVLRIPNVVSGRIDASDLKGAHFEEEEKHTYGLRQGDVLVVRSNGSISIVGRCALISKTEERYLYAGYLIRLRSNPTALLPEYLVVLLSSHLLRTQIEYKAKSTSGVNNINSREIQSLIVPLCGPSEQEVVMEQLRARLSVITATQAAIDSSLQTVKATRQAVLKEAFSGQLVPQDPKDEPASILLERIKAEKSEST